MELLKTPPMGTALSRGRIGYDVHRPFLPWRESKSLEVDAVVDALTDEITGVLRRRIERTKLKKHVRRIALELFIAFDSDPSCWLDYPRKEGKFGKGELFGRHHLRYDAFVSTVEALHTLGYIEHLIGSYRLGLQSSMRATSLLIEAIHTGRVEPRMVFADHEPIYLKDSEGRYIDVRESRRVGQMANRIVSLNQLLLGIDIQFPLTEAQRREYVRQAKRMPSMHNRTLYRVFNRGEINSGKLCFGGRFYGHAVQGIKGWWRQFVRINGESVCELDYGGMHIRLLYSKAGAVPPPGDVYDIGVNELEAARFNRTWGVDLRSVLKKLLLVSINAKTKAKAINATLEELTSALENSGTMSLDQERKKEFRGVLYQLLDALKSRHPSIAHFIGADQGIRLQRLDSDIADFILADFVKRGLPIIPIHDSFLVRARDRDLLWEVMDAAWRKFVPDVEPIIEDKVGKWNVVSKAESPRGLTGFLLPQMEEIGDGWEMGLVG